MAELAYVNGRYLPIEEAKVSIDDRGYQFGDGVYEVLYAFGGKPFLMEEHIRRLQNSLDGMEIHGVDMAVIRSVIRSLIDRGGFDRSKVYLSVTRGVAPRNHVFPAGVEPSVVGTVRPVAPANPALVENGLSAVTLDDFRWGRCDLKTLNLLANVLAKQEASRRGADEALLIAPDGTVREGTSANAFCVLGDTVWTHPLSRRILPGITRGLVLELAAQLGIPVREEGVDLETFRKADEVFLTGTTAELVGVTAIDGAPVGNGKPGPVTRRLYKAYEEYVAAFIAG